ncbi:MAG: hypothetical protein H7067_06640 [Burkholderiales bacterium]|nr:hypothetical protein [Opitutaceae bacterium]
MANPIIQAGGLFSNHFLEVTFLDLRLGDPKSIHPPGRRVSYRQINLLLLSSSNQLSLRIGPEYFTIPFKPDDAKHQQVLEALVAGLARA